MSNGRAWPHPRTEPGWSPQLMPAVFTLRGASGFTWMKTKAPQNDWQDVASSSDGIRLVAVAYDEGIYVSRNSGATWTKTDAPDGDWVSATTSADGTKFTGYSFFGPIAQPGNYYGIACSWDSGKTWTPNDETSFSRWRAGASSANGEKLVAAILDGPIYTSTDAGASWDETSAPIANWSSVASSEDGRKLVAVDASGGGIYISPDAGATWQITSAPSNSWSSVACSANGKRLVAAAGGWSSWGPIYLSDNSGATWYKANVPDAYWYDVAMSADGTKIVAADFYGSIYLCWNFGFRR